VIAELKEGIGYAATHPVLRSLMLIYVIANLLFMGPTGIGTPIVASEQLTEGAKGLSFMQSSFSIGMTLGFLALLAFPPKKKRLMLIVGLIAFEGVLLALLGQAHALPLAVLLQFMLGFCIACNNVPMISLIQQYTDRSKLGRVMSLNSISSMGLSPVSYAMVSTLLSGGISVRFIMPAFGLSMAVIVIAMAIASPTIRRTN
jgi:sugar phosphate permease